MNVNPSLSPKPGEGLALAKRNAVILAAASSVIGACAPLSVSLGAIAGDYLLEADKSLATAPVTGYTAGVAIGALPAAWLMRMIGRRYGFIGGAVITAIGGLVATAALFELHFWLFAFGLLIVGLGGSFVQQYRFAATDSAPESFKAQAISWVLIGGVFAAVIGPQTAILMKDFFAPVQFAGAFAAILFLATIGGLILSRLRNLFPHVESIMMDRDTMAHHERYVVEGNGSTPAAPANLTAAEADAFAFCSQDNCRLEQEKIGQPFVDRTMAEWIATSVRLAPTS